MRSTTVASAEHAGHDELGVHRGERRLQAGRAHRRLLERHLLLVARVRGVVGGDAVDRPVRRPSMSAWRSASVRSGGFIFMRVSSVRTASSVSDRWCGLASQVTPTPRPSRAATASTDAAQLRCWMWMRAAPS